MVVRILRGQTTIEALQHTPLTNRTGTPTKYLWVPASHSRFPLPDATSSVEVAGGNTEGSLRQRFQQHFELVSPRGAAVPLLPHERVYDIGTRENFRTFWAIPLLGAKESSS